MQLQNGWKYYDDLLLVISLDFLSNMKTELWNQTTMDGKILPEWKYMDTQNIYNTTSMNTVTDTIDTE